MKKPTTTKKPKQAKTARLSREQKAFDAKWAKLEKARLRREAKYQRELKQLERTGIYQPKDHTLTKYRKWRINKAVREYSEFLDPKTVFFIPVDKKARKKLFRNAEQLRMKTTKTGILLPKENYKRATIRKSKSKKGEYEIVRSGKTKRGPNAGKKYSDILPIEPIDSITAEKDRLRRIADSLGPLKKNERLAYRIVDDSGEGMSQWTFINIDLLLARLAEYQRSQAAKIFMLRHVIIEKTTVVEWKAERERKGYRVEKRKRKKQLRK